MFGLIFTLGFMILFWWAMVTGFKTLARRFFTFLGGTVSGDRSFGEQLSVMRAADAYIAPTLASVTSEMEATLAKERASASDLLGQAAERHELLKDAERTIASWDDKAHRALELGRDDLARAALAERFKASEWADSLRGEIARIDDLLRGYQVDIRSLQTRLNEVYRRRTMADARIDRANNGVAAYDLLHGDKWEEVQPDLASLDRNADFAEARLEAMSLGAAPATFGRRAASSAIAPTPSQASLLAPLTPPTRGSAIDEELAAMKARLAAAASQAGGAS